MKTANLAVMFADLAGYTRKTSDQSYEQNAAMLQRFSAVLLPIVKSFKGRVVKEIGDAVLAVFDSPTRAAEAAMAVQDRAAEMNRGRPDAEHMHLRVAINVGEVRIERGDVFGEAVNVAARIEAMTPVDGIYISGATYLTMNRSGVPLEAIGEKQLKGIPEPVSLFSVAANVEIVDEEGEVSTRKADAELPYRGRQLTSLRVAKRRVRRLATLAAAALVAAGAGVGTLVHERMADQQQLDAVSAAIDAGRLHHASDELMLRHREGLVIGQHFEALLDRLSASRDPASACGILGRLELQGLVDSAHVSDRFAELRIGHGTALLFEGEVAQARVCLAAVDVPESHPLARLHELSMIHVDALSAERQHNPRVLKQELRRYQTFLRSGTAPEEHLRLIARVVADAYEHKHTRAIADSIVVESLREQSARALSQRLLDDETSPIARAWILARLEDVAGDLPLDWASLYAAQLQTNETCTTRRAAIEGLHKLGHLSAVGMLLREASRRDRCTRTMASAAAHDLIAKGKVSHLTPDSPVLLATR